MPSKSVIAVVGKGIAGLTCAYRFADAGFAVTVFDCDRPSATKVATGMSCIKGNRLTDQNLFRLKVRGHSQLKTFLNELEKESGETLVHAGVIEPFANQSEYQVIAEKVFRRHFRGIFNVRRTALENNQHAFHYPDDIFFSSLKVLQTLESALLKRGVVFKKQQINRISTSNQNGYLQVGDDPHAVFQEVVLAAGDGSFEILESSGFSVHSLSRVWGETAVSPGLSVGKPKGFTKLGQSFVGLNEECRSGSVSWTNEGEATPETDQKREELRSEHLGFFGGSKDSVRFESGVRLRTRSRMPLVGEFWYDESGQHRLRVATAFYKNGWQFADIAACFHVSHVSNRDYESENFPEAGRPLEILT